ncbi:MAG TPA: SulP family inorganic anion transporter [Amaricoccus sp.]|uniref:SulP family inorganic anion transporter n=1 Tax=Amaricoccus sp. TaxID=1872485 RepID=UPI002C20DCDD|nr:SulP family inorganic anion transporter [Amaricoccus sp.]HMQ91524.1 SulP family inorganic anion transporter [Amaricoccus sp.]HMR50943.1 SulP family inorganic anion transporter [Amaricoccus sp.]HMR58886.1 SulP family inorganic anion transporter [Amaricoccus sp.]HMT97878.1 SulP family inorganic anion transporter [Amaricoccus sp.]
MSAGDAPSTRPVLASLAGYRPGWIKGDVAAGLAIAAVGLPTAIAYPAIAGLPPQTGLYASIAPLVAYAVFGPSRQLIVGPDAATVTVMAAVLATIPGLADADRAGVAAMLGLIVGGLYLGGRALGFGVLSTFLSRPILVGFFAGISLSIITGQLKRITGAPISSDGLIAPFIDLVRKAQLIHWPSLALAAAMFAVLQGARLRRVPVPGPVIVVVLAVALSALLDLPARGIATVGQIPSGVPALALPTGGGASPDRLLLGALAIFLVSFAAGIVTARSFGQRGGYPVDANREMLGFGAANIAAGLFSAFPVTASDSRTAINASVGGRSQIAGVVAAAALLLTILYLRPALAILPIPALGAILIAAAVSLIDVPALREVWRISRIEFVFAMIALVAPITLGVLNGVLIAIGATFAYLLHQMMRPRDALLGRIPGRDGFYKLHRRADARPVPGLTIALIEGDVLFFNADHIQARLLAIADAMPGDNRWFVIDASAITQIDSTAAAMLEEVRADLADRGVRLGLAELHANVAGLLDRAGLLAAIGPDLIFDDLDDALRAFGAGGANPGGIP